MTKVNNKASAVKIIGKKGLFVLAIVLMMVLMPAVYASSANTSSQATASAGSSATANSQATASAGSGATANSQATASAGSSAIANSQATASAGSSATANSQATALNGGSATAGSLADAHNGQSITSNAVVTASGSSRTVKVVNGVVTTTSDTSNGKGNSNNIVTTSSGKTVSYSSYGSTSSRKTANNVQTVNNVQTISNQISSNRGQIKNDRTVFVGSYKQTKEGRIIKSEEKHSTDYTSNTYRTYSKPKKDNSKENAPPTVETGNDENNVISQLLGYLRII